MRRFLLALSLMVLVVAAFSTGGSASTPAADPVPVSDGFSDGGDDPDACVPKHDAVECGGSVPCTAGRWLAPNEWNVVLCGWNNWRTLDISTAYISACCVQFYYYDSGPSAAFDHDVSHYQRPGYGYYNQIRVNNYTPYWVYVAVTATT